MTTVEALKDLFVALGGNASEFNATLNPEAVEKIAAQVGYVEPFVITATVKNTTTSNLDKTVAEITAAYKAGKTIIMDIPSTGTRLVASSINESGEICCCIFTSYDLSNNILYTFITDRTDDGTTHKATATAKAFALTAAV